MVMANGTQTHEKKIQFKPRKTVTEILPDAPEGGWDMLIPKGSVKLTQTAAEKGGDPVLNLAIKLVKAHEEANESYQGVSLRQRITFYDQTDTERRGAATMNYRFAKGLCDALELDFSDVYPSEITSSDDLLPFIAAIEGKPFEAWTVHRKSEYNGETMVNIDVRFKKPGVGLVTKSAEDDDEERPGRKAAKGKGSRR